MVKEKKQENYQEKTEKGRMRHPPTTFLNQAQGEGNIFKSKCKGPLFLSLCVYLFVLHGGPCPGGFGKCQAMDWQRMRGCGRELRGESEAGEEQCFLRFSDTIFVLHV